MGLEVEQLERAGNPDTGTSGVWLDVSANVATPARASATVMAAVVSGV